MEPLLKKVIKAWGREHQLQKIAEECNEFSTAYMHYLDGRPDAEEHLIEELADVLITAWQGRIILGKKEVDAAVNRKLEKLAAELAKKLEGDDGHE